MSRVHVFVYLGSRKLNIHSLQEIEEGKAFPVALPRMDRYTHYWIIKVKERYYYVSCVVLGQSSVALARVVALPW